MVLMFLVAAACAEAIAMIMVLLIVCRVAISMYTLRVAYFQQEDNLFCFLL